MPEHYCNDNEERKVMKRDINEFENYLSKLFRESGFPGVAISIRGPEGIIYQKGFGKRDLEEDLPVDEDTIFGIASMSKSMTALACAILHAEGKMSLEDPVTKYFPDFHIPGTPDELVTVRSLAMHRAGIPPMEPLEWSIAMNSVERDSEWHRQMVKTSPNKMDKIEQIVDYITEGNYVPLGMPGEYMSYSNEGYALLSYIVDKASGIPLEEFLEERIFKPLGMTRTVLDEDASRAIEIADGNITCLFERDENGNLVQDKDWSVLPPFRGCACVKSTARDMSKYYKMISDKGVWDNEQVIPAKAIELMVGSEYPNTEKPFYCLGLYKELINGKLIWEHSGALHGVSTSGGGIEGGYSAVALCNEGEISTDKFQWACYNFILGLPLDREHFWAVPSGNTFSMPEALCGDFLAKEGIPCHVIVDYKDGKLGGTYDGKAMELQYCKNTVFVAIESETKKRLNNVEFFLRDGKAWGAKCGSRIYQKVCD